MPIAEQQVKQYDAEGFFQIDGFLSESEVEALRRECDGAVARIESKMDEKGTDKLGLSRRGQIYFKNFPSQSNPTVRDLVFGPTMETLVRSLLGDAVFLYADNFFVKGTDEEQMVFQWHQDIGFVRKQLDSDVDFTPYLSCWIPLDDVDEENGTMYVLPYSRAGGSEARDHTDDLSAYTGDDPGVAAVCKAGSLFAFSSHSLHRSGPNNTAQMRRAFMVQYSPEVIRKPDGSPFQLAEPFLEGGKRAEIAPVAAR